MGWPDPKFRTKICEILIPGIFARNRMSVADELSKNRTCGSWYGHASHTAPLVSGPKTRAARREKSRDIFAR